MAGLACTPDTLPSIRHPVLRVLRALRHILELSHGATPAGKAMERAQGVSSGPWGPDTMVMVCFIVSFVKTRAILSQFPKPQRAVYLITNRPCLFYHLRLFTNLWSDQWPRKFVTLDCDNREPSDSNWTFCLMRGSECIQVLPSRPVSLLFCFLKL